MARLNELMRAMNNPEKGIGAIILEKNKEKFEKKKGIFTSIIKCLEIFWETGDWFKRPLRRKYS